MSTRVVQVRTAVEADVEAAAEVLTAGFLDYPWTAWTVDREDREQRLRALHRLYLSRVGVPFGHVDLGVVDSEVAAVAVWLRASDVPAEVWADIAPAAVELAGARAAAAAAADAALAPYRPSDEHLLLASVAVAPERQGTGLGTRTLAPGLERADLEQLPVHLETSSERNVRFYGRLGFGVVEAVELPGGGPRTWLMRRPVRRAG